MPRPAKRRQSNGALRRQPKRQRSKNTRWMHLSAADVGTRESLQYCWSFSSIASTMTLLMLTLSVAMEEFAADPATVAEIDSVVENLVLVLCTYLSLNNAWSTTDGLLFDIPPWEELMPTRYRPRRHLRIDHLDDVTALKMTRFSHGQLRRMYNCFDFVNQCEPGEDEVSLYTGFIVGNTRCHYKVHPEELFLYTVTKILTGLSHEKIADEYFGGDYVRWGLAYKWTLRYLDSRYDPIIGHQGLLRFVNDFPRFHNAIESYCQRERTHHQHDGSTIVYPGLNHLPWRVFGFIDDSIDRISVPYSGPDGDYEGAPRRKEYDDAQRSVYTGYKKCHGIKVETVFLPNGISTLFGPVSARNSDVSLLNMSGLNNFLMAIQAGIYIELFKAFGDNAFGLGLVCITSYFRAFGRNAQVSVEEDKCNKAMKSARIAIEKNYAEVSCLFKCCDNRASYKLAERGTVALQQLRVCHLLMNCYNCLKGDQASCVNTFGVTPPRLEDYLQL